MCVFQAVKLWTRKPYILATLKLQWTLYRYMNYLFTTLTR